MDADLRTRIVETARGYLGVKWRHQGRTLAHGVDCVGLIICVVHDLGITDYDNTQYSRRANRQSLTQPFEAHCRRKPLRDREPGDIVLMRDEVYPCHAAWVSFDSFIIHSSVMRRRVCEESESTFVRLLTHCYELNALHSGSGPRSDGRSCLTTRA